MAENISILKTYVLAILFILIVIPVGYFFNILIYVGIALGLISPNIFVIGAHKHDRKYTYLGLVFLISGLLVLAGGMILL